MDRRTRLIGSVVLAIPLAATVAIALSSPSARRAQARDRPRIEIKPHPIDVRGNAIVAIPRLQLPVHRGTVIRTTPDLDEIDEQAHRAVADLFQLIDPINVERFNHFAWLDRHSIDMVGWVGTVNEVIPVGNGYYVSVSLRPQVSHEGGGSIAIVDSLVETYWIDSEGLHLLGVIRPERSLADTYFID